MRSIFLLRQFLRCALVFGRRVVCIVGAALALMLSDLCGDDGGRVCAVRVGVCVGAAETM